MLKTFQAAQPEITHLMFNGAMSFKHNRAPVGPWQSESESRVIYCGQKRLELQSESCFLMTQGQGQGIFSCMSTTHNVYKFPQRHILLLQHHVKMHTHIHMHSVSHWTLQCLQKMMLLSSSLKNSFSSKFNFILKYLFAF